MAFLQLERIENYRRNRRENRLGKLRLTSYPVFVYADITSRCNLSCVMCEQHYFKDNRGDMTGETFSRLLPILDRSLILFMHATGEPLIHKQFLSLFLQAKERGVLVGFSSNGHLVVQDTADALVGGGLNFLNFSIDSTDPEQFAKIRQKGNLHRVLKSIDMFNHAKTRLRRNNPLLGIAFCAMQDNLDQLPDIVDLATSKKIISVTARNVISNDALKDKEVFKREGNLRDPAYAEQVARKAQKRAREQGVMLRLDRSFFRETGTPGTPGKGRGPLCSEVWQGAYIHFDGTVRPCCISNHAMGNINDTPFEEIWNNSEYQRFRQQFREGTFPPSCAFCKTNWFRNRVDAYHLSFINLLKQRHFGVFYRSIRQMMG